MNKRGVFWLVAGLAFVAVVAFATWQSIQANVPAAPSAMPMGEVPKTVRVGHNADLPVPTRLGGLHVGQVETGPQAVADIVGMHLAGFRLDDGYVAHYGAGQDTATVWLARVDGETAARSLVERMTARMIDSRSPFSRPEPRQTAGRTVYATSGQGQDHYYFQSGPLVVWLAAGSNRAEQGLNELLRVIR